MKARRQSGFSLVELVLFIVIVGVAVSAIMSVYVQGVSGSADPVIRQRAIAVASAYMDEILRKRWNENAPLGGGCVVTGTAICAAGATTWATATAYAANAIVRPTAPAAVDCYYRTNAAGTSGAAEPTWPGMLGTSVVDGGVTWTCVAMDAASAGPDGTETRATFDDVDDYAIASEAPTDQNGNPMGPGGEFAGYSVAVNVSQPAADFNGISAADAREIVVTVNTPQNEDIVLRAVRVNF